MDPLPERVGNKTVVIVDDSAFILNRLERFFSEELHCTVVAQGRDGNEAIALYEKHTPDLITLDISMPVKRGNDAAREILARFPDARIMIVSAVRGDEILQCMSCGAKNYMEKPLRFENADYRREFIETVNDIFQDKKAE
jgi:YesN/AraC family two-component response regulator